MFDICPKCKNNMKDGEYSRVIGVEYPYDDPLRYDGVSEWRCPDCGYRQGRWTGRELVGNEGEPRYGGK